MHTLTPEQEEFNAAEGKVVLCACPGSGKTYVVARKLLSYIQTWQCSHQGVAVLSFTNVASQEIEKQAKELMDDGFKIEHPHFVGTIDSFINTFILLRFGYLMNKEVPKRPTIVINNIFQFPYKYWRSECHRQGCIEGICEFRWDINGDLYRKKNRVTCSAGTYGTPCKQYKKMLLDKGYVFQNEAAALSYLLLKKYPDISKAIAARFPIIIIDETQDTSIEQMAVLDLLTEAGMRSVFLVGDPDQSIYEWRSATPECFLDKMRAKEWKTIYLTTNFRSSQTICNATQAFANSLANKPPSTAVGDCAKHGQKPVLILYNDQVDESTIIKKFIELCQDNSITEANSDIAVVTRGRIHSNTDVHGLWKSIEIELLAQSAYEWYYRSRKKAFELCEKALFSMAIKELRDIDITIAADIESIMVYDTWKFWIISILCRFPSPQKTLNSWITELKSILVNLLDQLKITLREGILIDEVIKIKTRDKKILVLKIYH
ncbi:Superfamily I DNA or RNA helicase [Propionispira arboris]|uniref:DNA 3'-5' helicase n=1 Tax=Propionispira arboris TaxID=84035 RepID=A0A1H7B211_9FIRM|nr:ATP-dependent helicase [Propionispira arboris]SEJ71508.1 Superfamily I DNA or RNA helicase [Propionispira arboris]